MSQIVVRDLSPETVETLKQRAKRNRRSLQAEVALILDEIAARESRPMSVQEFRRFADEIAARSGPQKTDSVNLIREDRDR